MVSIVVGDCDPETDQLTSNTLQQCEEMNITATSGPSNSVSTPATDNEQMTSTTSKPKLNFSNTTATMTMGSTSTTQASINQTVNSESEIKLSTTSDRTIIISTVFSLILLIIFLILSFLTVLTLVAKQRRKPASMNAFDPIEMSTQPRMLHNPSSESITDSTQEVKHDEAVDYIEANHVYATDTLPTDPNVAYGTVDCIEVDSNPAYGTNTVPTNPNVAYGTTNAVPTSPTVAYGTHPPQMHNYEYVALP